MIDLQFVPSTTGAAAGRRIDLTSLAGQFSELYEAEPRGGKKRALAQIVVMILVLAGAIGDTVLIAQRDAVASCLASAAPVKPIVRASTF